jgi:hypothetical protein
MIWVGLNKILNYTLKGKTFRPSLTDLRLIYNPAIRKENWDDPTFKKYKDEIKDSHYFDQGRRCAYCRLKLRTDAYWDELDHIVPQTIMGEWIFYPKNLVVSCKPCNSLKNAFDTRANNLSNRFPLYSNGFTVFNPHFDIWADHFEIFKEIFLRGKPGTKGPATYSNYKLYRYHIIVGYSEESRFRSRKTLRRLTHLLREPSLTLKQIENIQKAIAHMVKVKKHDR